MRVLATMVIADDHQILRDGLKEHFGGKGGFEIVGAVGDAQSAVYVCRQFQPDLLLLDVEMPGRDSLGAIADIKAASPKTKIVILTAFCRDAIIEVAVRSGAAGYVLKCDTPQSIYDAVCRVLKGEHVYSKSVKVRMSLADGAAKGPGISVTPLSRLTPREVEVLRYIGRGHDNAQMAADMHLSIRTVERHVLRLMRDLDIDNRTRLTVFAHESGLVN